MDRSSFDGTGISICSFFSLSSTENGQSFTWADRGYFAHIDGFPGIRRRWDPCVARSAFWSPVSSHFVPLTHTSSCNKCPLYRSLHSPASSRDEARSCWPVRKKLVTWRDQHVAHAHTPSRNSPPHKTPSDKPMSLSQSPTLFTPTVSQPLSRHQHQHHQIIVLEKATFTQVRGPTVAHWSMFCDQQPKRKGISKEPDKATSEPGEAKLLDAVAMLTLNLESEKISSSWPEHCLQDTEGQWARRPSPGGHRGIYHRGQNARDAAKNKGEQYRGHPQGKRPWCINTIALVARGEADHGRGGEDHAGPR